MAKIEMGIMCWETCHTEESKNMGVKWNRGASDERSEVYLLYVTFLEVDVLRLLPNS
jgi:hypothetical protein